MRISVWVRSGLSSRRIFLPVPKVVLQPFPDLSRVKVPNYRKDGIIGEVVSLMKFYNVKSSNHFQPFQGAYGRVAIRVVIKKEFVHVAFCNDSAVVLLSKDRGPGLLLMPL